MRIPRQGFKGIDNVSQFIVFMLVICFLSMSLREGSTVVTAEPEFKDPNLRAEIVVQGLSSPTSMAFIDDNTILVTEKNTGAVRLVSNSMLQQDPILQLDVDTTTLTCCRGLLGVATRTQDHTKTDVFLYLSEASHENIPVRNKLYKYQWDHNSKSLVNPILLLDLPATPGPNHPGGKIAIGLDNYLYTVIGDLNNEGQLQNIKNGPGPSDSSVILKIDPVDGSAAQGNPFVDISDTNNDETHILENQMDKYYAYGIRNSFGLAVDPISGILWDTENGDEDYDEMNIVQPGFNSGWKVLMGPMSENEGTTIDDLVMFEGAHYADPILSWEPSLGITDIEFFDSSNYGSQYRNNIFVGDISNGNLYFFRVNDNRTGIILESLGAYKDPVADDEELENITIATGFAGITDIETGPDGLLYVLTFDQDSNGEGSIYRIHKN